MSSKQASAANIIDVPGIGRVVCERSLRARRVVISIRLFKGVRVAVPARVSFEEALEFVHRKKAWILKHLATTKQRENEIRETRALCASIDPIFAREILTGRIRYLADKHGFSFNKVSIRSQKTRWGSCSRKNNISLNVKLVLLPDDLRDYVIFHELVHTKVHDHSKRFWAELDKYVGDGKAKSKILKQNGLSLS
ncbi:MAG: SprT family zinc-dependent metalloprotease [Dehalococcoidales bacterium]|nr:SprT family zinc-dependent metalloprotease [Dehalococcoidales bacterium]